jgi:hypothetical protein
MLIVYITIIVRVTFYMSNAAIHSTVTIKFSIKAALKPFLDCYRNDKTRVISDGLGKYNVQSWVAYTFSWSIHKTNLKET